MNRKIFKIVSLLLIQAVLGIECVWAANMASLSPKLNLDNELIAQIFLVGGRQYAKEYLFSKSPQANTLIYPLLVEHSADSIYIVCMKDGKCIYEFANKAHLRNRFQKFGVEIEEIKGVEYEKHHSIPETADFTKQVKAVLKFKKMIKYVYRSEKDKRWFIRTLTYFKDKVIVISKDVTELQTVKKDMEGVNQLQKLILDIITHDLQNKVTIASGFSDLLLEKEEDETRRSMIKMILNALRQTEELLENVTVFSKFSSRNYKEEYRVRNIGLIIEEVIGELKFKAQSKNITLKTKNIAENYDVNALSFIKDVFLNLIDNALKYSLEKTTVEVDIKDAGEYWKISIKDEGSGIKDEHKKMIFKRFERADAGSIGIQGSGLGLAIVKQLVLLHEGRIWVEDNYPQGSIFYLELPKVDSELRKLSPPEQELNELPDKPTKPARKMGVPHGATFKKIKLSVDSGFIKQAV